jgi:hypothetical protein
MDIQKLELLLKKVNQAITLINKYKESDKQKSQRIIELEEQIKLLAEDNQQLKISINNLNIELNENNELQNELENKIIEILKTLPDEDQNTFTDIYQNSQEDNEENLDYATKKVINDNANPQTEAEVYFTERNIFTEELSEEQINTEYIEDKIDNDNFLGNEEINCPIEKQDFEETIDDKEEEIIKNFFNNPELENKELFNDHRSQSSETETDGTLTVIEEDNSTTEELLSPAGNSANHHLLDEDENLSPNFDSTLFDDTNDNESCNEFAGEELPKGVL